MKHQHSFAPAGEVGHRCRLCSANDLDGLIDEIAAAMWEQHRDLVLKDPPWEDASDHWKETLRGYAREMVDIVRR